MASNPMVNTCLTLVNSIYQVLMQEKDKKLAEELEVVKSQLIEAEKRNAALEKDVSSMEEARAATDAQHSQILEHLKEVKAMVDGPTSRPPQHTVLIHSNFEAMSAALSRMYLVGGRSEGGGRGGGGVLPPFLVQPPPHLPSLLDGRPQPPSFRGGCGKPSGGRGDWRGGRGDWRGGRGDSRGGRGDSRGGRGDWRGGRGDSRGGRGDSRGGRGDWRGSRGDSRGGRGDWRGGRGDSRGGRGDWRGGRGDSRGGRGDSRGGRGDLGDGRRHSRGGVSHNDTRSVNHNSQGDSAFNGFRLDSKGAERDVTGDVVRRFISSGIISKSQALSEGIDLNGRVGNVKVESGARVEFPETLRDVVDFKEAHPSATVSYTRL